MLANDVVVWSVVPALHLRITCNPPPPPRFTNHDQTSCLYMYINSSFIPPVPPCYRPVSFQPTTVQFLKRNYVTTTTAGENENPEGIRRPRDRFGLRRGRRVLVGHPIALSTGRIHLSGIQILPGHRNEAAR